MRCVIEGAQFARVLNLVKGCVPNRATMPIVQHVLLKAEGSTLRVTATNLDREASATAPAQMDRPGTIAIPGKILCDFSQRLAPGAQVGIELNPANGRVTVTAGAGKYVFKAMDGADFPTIGNLQRDPVEFEIASQDFLALLSTNYAAASDARREGLYGVRLNVGDKKLFAMGFDDVRLSYKAMAMPVGADAMKPVTIPYDAVPEICRLLAEEESVVVSAGGLFQFHTPTFSFTTKVMGTKFPDEQCYTALKNILSTSKPIGKIHPTVFKDVLKRASVVYASGLAKFEPAVVEFTEAGAVLTMGEGDGDTAREELDAEPLAVGQKFRVNRHFLEDVVNGWPENQDVTVCMMAEPGRPILFKNDKDPNALQFMAPMLGAGRTANREAA
jgi:DNA polymerase-3 subunit beta